MPDFVVSGFKHTPARVQRLVRKSLKEGSEIQVIPDPSNSYDSTAIKVLFQGEQIGWVGKNCNDKEYIFEKLTAGNDYEAVCEWNRMESDDYGSYRSIGVWIKFKPKRK